MSSKEGTVYMLCFARSLGDPTRSRMSAKHYVGYFDNPERIEQHRNGTSGVKIVYAFFQRGIPFIVSRKMPGVKEDERKIKKNGQHAQHCPNCTAKPWRGAWK